MSSLSLLFILSPTITGYSRYSVVVPTRAEIGSSRPAVGLRLTGGGKDKGNSKLRKLVVAQAGIGRYSGAVHGSNTRRARRRRPTLRPDDFDGNSSADENERVIIYTKGLISTHRMNLFNFCFNFFTKLNLANHDFYSVLTR